MAEPPAHETHAASLEPGSRASFSPLLWMFLAVFLLYPLSVGPAVRFAIHKPRYWPFTETIYAPLGFLCDHCPPVDKFFNWYIVGLWGVK